MDEQSSSEELLKALVADDQEAARVLFDRYSERLLSLVNRSLSQQLSRRIESEDVVQSVFRSFFVRARRGEFEFDHADGIWKLLVTIALNKVRKAANYHRAQKRAVGREESTSTTDWAKSRDATPTDAAVVLDELNQVVENADSDAREMLALWLEGNTTSEIADIRRCSERTVQRVFQKIRKELESRLLTSNATSIREYAWHDVVLKRFLGSGGFGKAYKGHDRISGEVVAIKTLKKSRLQDPLSIATFLQESRNLIRLSHTNIVGIHGVGRFPFGGFFIVMDFVDGRDLQCLIEKTELSVQEVIEKMIVICKALLFAHQQGIVHGDIKPANILVSRDDTLFVTDFAMVPLAALNSGATIGTKEFSAPELVSRGTVTQSCDVYSLGVLLQTMLSESSRSSAIEEIIETATNRNPDERYASVNELVIALKNFS